MGLQEEQQQLLITESSLQSHTGDFNLGVVGRHWSFQEGDTIYSCVLGYASSANCGFEPRGYSLPLLLVTVGSTVLFSESRAEKDSVTII